MIKIPSSKECVNKYIVPVFYIDIDPNSTVCSPNGLLPIANGQVCKSESEYLKVVKNVRNDIYNRIKSGKIVFKCIANFDPDFLYIDQSGAICYNDGSKDYYLVHLFKEDIEIVRYLGEEVGATLYYDDYAVSYFNGLWYIMYIGEHIGDREYDTPIPILGTLNNESTTLDDLINHINYSISNNYRYLMND